MEKYAVELDKEKTKVASSDEALICPKCGGPNENNWCRICGTLPFEKVKQSDK